MIKYGEPIVYLYNVGCFIVSFCNVKYTNYLAWTIILGNLRHKESRPTVWMEANEMKWIVHYATSVNI